MATVAQRLRQETIERARQMSPAERLSEALALVFRRASNGGGPLTVMSRTPRHLCASPGDNDAS